MKIAILFSGRINKNIYQYTNFIQNIVQYNICDIFIVYPKNTPELLVSQVEKMYQPKFIIKNFEEYFNVDKYKKRKETNKHNTMCMFSGRYVLQQNFINYIEKYNPYYDLVISLRMDLIFKEKLDYQQILQQLSNQNNFLLIPNPCFDHAKGINDQVAIGNCQSIIKYLELYIHLYDILENGTIFHPETLLRKYLENTNFNLHRFYIEYFINRY